VRRRGEPTREHLADRAERALLRRAARAVGHGDRARPEARETLDRLVEKLGLRLGLRREELEGDGGEGVYSRGAGGGALPRDPALPLPASAARRSRADQMVTVSPSEPVAGARSSAASSDSPAPAIH